MKSLDTGTVKTLVYASIILIIIVAVYVIIRKLTKPSPGQKEKDIHDAQTKNIVGILNNADIFKVETYDNAKNDPMISKERFLSANESADAVSKIHNALHGILHSLFVSDTSAVIGVFKSLKDPIQVSQLSRAYMDTYNADMEYDIKTNFNGINWKDDLSNLYDVINNIGK